MKKLECPECGKNYLTRAAGDLVGRRKGESFTIRITTLACPNCGFKTIPKDLMGEFALCTADAYREAHGLLTSQEIKDIRAKLNLTQQEFADFLHVGVASVKRWELGEIQDAAMNRLIVLSVEALERELEAQEFGPWGGFEQVEEYCEEDLEPQFVGVAGLPNGPPTGNGPEEAAESFACDGYE